MIQNHTLALNFVKNHRHLKIHLDLQNKQFMMTKKTKKNLHILEDHASVVQGGDIE